MKRLKKHIRKNPAVLESLPVGAVSLSEVIFDIIQGLIYSLNVISGKIEYSKLTVFDCLKNINSALKYLLSCVYEKPENIPVIADAFSRYNADSIFRDWFCSTSTAPLGESLFVRALAFVRIFPELGDIGLLSREFLLQLNVNDLYLNFPDRTNENVFSATIETIPCYVQFPESESEFNETFCLIEQEVMRKIETLKDKKESLLFKDFDYQRMVYEQGEEYSERGAALLFEILMTENELRQFLFAGLNIPLCYLVYFIALDEMGHFSSVVRQAAANALYNAPYGFLWEKFNALRGYFFNAHCAAAPIVPDASVQEFAYSMEKALRLLGFNFEYGTIAEIAREVFDTMPEGRAFLHDFPLKISTAKGDELLSHQWYTLRLKTYWKEKDDSATKRITEILDYSIPNSRGIPAALFRDKNLAVPFIHREYLCSRNIVNEAEIRLRSKTPFIQPSFVRTRNIERTRDLVLAFMDFLEMYAQGGGRMKRDDIALLLERHFDLSALTAESLLHAKIMLWYIEPVHGIFKIDEANEAALARINEYIEGIYGKPLSAEKAVEKARAVIAVENEKIAEMNGGLVEEAETWPLLQEDKPQWARLFNILVRHYTRRNTLTLWELRGVLYDMREKPRKPFYYPVAAAIGSKLQKTLSQVLRDFEKDYKWFRKARERLYDCIYKSLDKAENKIDVCGWQELDGKCLRLDRQCCSIPYPCGELTDKKCGLRALTCKFWLCTAAQARAASTWRGRRLLGMRRFYSFWCQALNVPLKVRCSRRDSFDDDAKARFADLAEGWYDVALRGRD
ncbi:MAG: hypothetical protein LBQ89_01465 [Treponema sp.]|nr:hypothetical protein [Treponema sp.]